MDQGAIVQFGIAAHKDASVDQSLKTIQQFEVEYKKWLVTLDRITATRQKMQALDANENASILQRVGAHQKYNEQLFKEEAILGRLSATKAKFTADSVTLLALEQKEIANLAVMARNEQELVRIRASGNAQTMAMIEARKAASHAAYVAELRELEAIETRRAAMARSFTNLGPQFHPLAGGVSPQINAASPNYGYSVVPEAGTQWGGHMIPTSVRAPLQPLAGPIAPRINAPSIAGGYSSAPMAGVGWGGHMFDVDAAEAATFARLQGPASSFWNKPAGAMGSIYASKFAAEEALLGKGAGGLGAATAAGKGLNVLEKEAGAVASQFSKVRIPHWLQGLSMYAGLPIYSGGGPAAVGVAGGVVAVGVTVASKASQKEYEDLQTEFANMRKDLDSLGDNSKKTVEIGRGLLRKSVAWGTTPEMATETQFNIESALPEPIFNRRQQQVAERMAYAWSRDVTNAPIKNISDLLTTGVTATGGRFGDFNANPEEFMRRQSNVFFKTQAMGKFSIEDMSKSFPVFLSTATQMKYDPIEVFAAVAAASAQEGEFANRTKVATATRNILSILREKQQKGELKSTGSFLGDVMGNTESQLLLTGAGEIGRRNISVWSSMLQAQQRGDMGQYYREIQGALDNPADIVLEKGRQRRAGDPEGKYAMLKDMAKSFEENAPLMASPDSAMGVRDMDYRFYRANLLSKSSSAMQWWAKIRAPLAYGADALLGTNIMAGGASEGMGRAEEMARSAGNIEAADLLKQMKKSLDEISVNTGYTIDVARGIKYLRFPITPQAVLEKKWAEEAQTESFAMIPKTGEQKAEAALGDLVGPERLTLSKFDDMTFGETLFGKGFKPAKQEAFKKPDELGFPYNLDVSRLTKAQKDTLARRGISVNDILREQRKHQRALRQSQGEFPPFQKRSEAPKSAEDAFGDLYGDHPSFLKSMDMKRQDTGRDLEWPYSLDLDNLKPGQIKALESKGFDVYALRLKKEELMAAPRLMGRYEGGPGTPQQTKVNVLPPEESPVADYAIKLSAQLELFPMVLDAVYRGLLKLQGAFDRLNAKDDRQGPPATIGSAPRYVPIKKSIPTPVRKPVRTTWESNPT